MGARRNLEPVGRKPVDAVGKRNRPLLGDRNDGNDIGPSAQKVVKPGKTGVFTKTLMRFIPDFIHESGIFAQTFTAAFGHDDAISERRHLARKRKRRPVISQKKDCLGFGHVRFSNDLPARMRPRGDAA